jgi:hypothetical protein
VGFIGDDDDVRSRGELLMIRFALFETEFLDGRKDNFTPLGLEQVSELIDIVRVLYIPNQRTRNNELIVELVV